MVPVKRKNLSDTRACVLVFANVLVLPTANDRDPQNDINILKDEITAINKKIQPVRTKFMRIETKPLTILSIRMLISSKKVYIDEEVTWRIEEGGKVYCVPNSKWGKELRIVDQHLEGIPNPLLPFFIRTSLEVESADVVLEDHKCFGNFLRMDQERPTYKTRM